MPIVIAKCTNCGANLNVDNAKDAAICEFCGAAFIIEKAINNYTVSNNNNITNSVVNIYSETQSDFIIRAGELLKYTGVEINIIIPDSVVSINKKVFKDFKNLKSVIIPNSVTSIGYYAFSGCSNLTSVTLPNSLIEIDDFAFRACSNLTSITLPNSLEYIGANAFEGCVSLIKINIPEKLSKIESCTFGYCENLTTIFIPPQIKSIEELAFVYCDNLSNVTISNEKTILTPNAFLKTPWDAKATEFRKNASKLNKKSGGCYVATSIYGSYDCPQVWTLRRFRDETLSKSWLGAKFISFYYATSPTLVKHFGNSKAFKKTFTSILNKLVNYLNKKGLSNTQYKDK